MHFQALIDLLLHLYLPTYLNIQFFTFSTLIHNKCMHPHFFHTDLKLNITLCGSINQIILLFTIRNMLKIVWDTINWLLNNEINTIYWSQFFPALGTQLFVISIFCLSKKVCKTIFERLRKGGKLRNNPYQIFFYENSIFQRQMIREGGKLRNNHTKSSFMKI